MDDKFKEMLESAKKGTSRTGKTALVKYLSSGGKKLQPKSAIAAKCYDCNGMGESVECDIVTCSLFPYSPYNPNPQKTTLSEAQMKASRANVAKAHEKLQNARCQ